MFSVSPSRKAGLTQLRITQYGTRAISEPKSAGRNAWRGGRRPSRSSYPSFDEWKDAAAHCDETAHLLPEVRKARTSAKLVAPDRLAEAVSRWIDWEAFAYWARPALELNSEASYRSSA